MIVIDNKQKEIIESLLSKDQRVELIPTKEGVKIIHVTRREAKSKN